MENKNYFIELNSINVNDKTEKKNGLTYLSWAWAWGEVKKLYPNANYKVYETENGINYFTDGRTGWVKTGVIINDIEHIEYLPIMDYKNKSIPLEQITSFDVNKTIQRSLTKAVARHGLGLYIYAGEDLPEEETQEEKPKVKETTKKAENKGFQIEEKEIITKEEKTLKNEDIELPFNDVEEKDVFAERKNIQLLNQFRDTIASKLYQINPNQDFQKAYSYFAKQYNKPTFEELGSDELCKVIEYLDGILEKRGVN